jgi:acyl carrier protein
MRNVSSADRQVACWTDEERIVKNDILDAVYAGIDQLNRQNPDSKPIRKAPDTPLYGSESALDSLGLINLIVAVEQRVEQRLRVPITLADDRALSQEVSPFSSVQALVDYIDKLLQEQKNG